VQQARYAEESTTAARNASQLPQPPWGRSWAQSVSSTGQQVDQQAGWTGTDEWEQQAGFRKLPAKNQGLMPVKEEMPPGYQTQYGMPMKQELDREARVRAVAERIRAEARRNEEILEQETSQAVSGVLHPLEEKVDAAEKAAEKVVTLAAPLALEVNDEDKELQLQVVRAIERSVKSAMGTGTVARREIERTSAEVEALAPLAREHARENLRQLVGRLAQAGGKLDEYRHVRKEFELTCLEHDAQRATMAAEPLAVALSSNPDNITSFDIAETKKALQSAHAALVPTLVSIQSQVHAERGASRNKLLKMQSRAESMSAALSKALQTLDQGQSKAAGTLVIKQATEAVAKTKEALNNMHETEAPFLIGRKKLTREIALELLQQMDKARAIAQGELVEARRHFNLGVKEAARLPGAVGESTRAQLANAKKQIDEGMDVVQRFQKEAVVWRREHLDEVLSQETGEDNSAAWERSGFSSSSLSIGQDWLKSSGLLQIKSEDPDEDEIEEDGNAGDEEGDGRKVDSMLPALEEKVVAAEDETEKISILVLPLQLDFAEEIKQLQLDAVRETERAIKAATGIGTIARRELERRMKDVEGLAPSAKKRAKVAIRKLVQRLVTAGERLDEHKYVRRDYERAVAAAKDFEDLQCRLASVEIDCEKAAIMAVPISKALDMNPYDINAAEVRETKEALRVAQTALTPTTRLIAGQVSGLKGPMRNRVLELQTRAEASQTMLDGVQRIIGEAASRAAAAPILKQAAERVARTEDVLNDMRETEAPLLAGNIAMSPEEAEELFGQIDRAVDLARSELADAQKFIELKSVEVGRLSEGTVESIRVELESARQQIDGGLDKVRKFQIESANWRREHLIEVIKVKVNDAEAEVLKTKESLAELQNQLGVPTEALDKARGVEQDAVKLFQTAQTEVQGKEKYFQPIEGERSEGIKISSEFFRLKARVNYMQAELNRFRKVIQETEEKQQVGDALKDVIDCLKESEAETERLFTASRSWSADQKPPAEDEQGIVNAQKKLTAATSDVEKRLRTAQGIELKELRTIFGRLKHTKSKLDRVSVTARDRSRVMFMQLMREASESVKKGEQEVSAVSHWVPSLSKLSVTRLEALHQQAGKALELVLGAQKSLSTADTLTLPPESRVEHNKLQLRCKMIETRGKSVSDNVSGQLSEVGAEAAQQALDALRTAARKKDGTYDIEAVFTELSEGDAEIFERGFSNYFTKHKLDVAMSADRVSLAFKKIVRHGLTFHIFAAALADVHKVVHDISLTDTFEIKSAKKVRKLEIGEIMEALGGKQLDETLGLERVQCRAIKDGTVGWVTARSKSGMEYLARTEKPFLWCTDCTPIRKKMDDSSDTVRQLSPGEVLELLEGPRMEQPSTDLRVRGVSCHDNTTGWLQVSDSQGNVLATLSNKVHKCEVAIAMTDESDLDKCSMVRRIDVGEALERQEGEQQMNVDGATRVKFRACRDGSVGWVTTQGNQGTVFVKSAAKHFVCVQAAPVHAGLSADSAVVRVMMPGEAFAAVEDPTPKKVAGGDRLVFHSVRAIIDGAQGWVASSAEAGKIRVWSSRYKIVKPVPLTRSLAAHEAAEVFKVVRMLEAGEFVDVAEQPTEDKSTGQLRTRCVATTDGVSGWATVREAGDTGAMFMVPVSDREPARTGTVGRGTKRPMDDKQEASDGQAVKYVPLRAGQPHKQVKRS